ncbi:hypothetical protein CYMTET_26117 [Cymbomonas tetramitiformis]|uniref:Uncharacterized protein n=1 Tax=Cymbomonas tetramitiformis TaxID=36881 RepID=A0AAE0KY93_9CHLO|nr:hypothetical protein CYMTET_26117 [Cymbomonas tetramitiformis]
MRATILNEREDPAPQLTAIRTLGDKHARVNQEYSEAKRVKDLWHVLADSAKQTPFVTPLYINVIRELRAGSTGRDKDMSASEIVLSDGREAPDGPLRIGRIQTRGRVSVVETAQERRKLGERRKTLDELRAALVCMDASMSAILSRFGGADASTFERLERSDLSDMARHHLTRWVRNEISGRYCLLLLEREMVSSQPNASKVRFKKNMEEGAIENVMDLIGAMVGLVEDSGWQWSGSWLFDMVFSKPPATVLKEAVEAMAELTDQVALSGALKDAAPTKRRQLAAEEINLVFRRISMRATSVDGAVAGENEQEAVDGGGVADNEQTSVVTSWQQYMRTQIWKELFHIHANGEDELQDDAVKCEAPPPPEEPESKGDHPKLVACSLSGVQENAECSAVGQEVRGGRAECPRWVRRCGGGSAAECLRWSGGAGQEVLSAYVVRRCAGEEVECPRPRGGRKSLSARGGSEVREEALSARGGSGVRGGSAECPRGAGEEGAECPCNKRCWEEVAGSARGGSEVRGRKC